MGVLMLNGASTLLHFHSGTANVGFTNMVYQGQVECSVSWSTQMTWSTQSSLFTGGMDSWAVTISVPAHNAIYNFGGCESTGGQRTALKFYVSPTGTSAAPFAMRVMNPPPWTYMCGPVVSLSASGTKIVLAGGNPPGPSSLASADVYISDSFVQSWTKVTPYMTR